MMKVFGSGLALALGAGAIYYWWMHNHGDMEGEFREMGDHFKDTTKNAKDSLEHS